MIYQKIYGIIENIIKTSYQILSSLMKSLRDITMKRKKGYYSISAVAKMFSVHHQILYSFHFGAV